MNDSESSNNLTEGHHLRCSSLEVRRIRSLTNVVASRVLGRERYMIQRLQLEC